MRPDVAIWGRRPPPIGGVTRSVLLLEAALGDKGVSVVVVDVGSPRLLLQGLFLESGIGAHFHLFNVSTFQSLWRASRFARALPGFSTLYLHSGDFPSRWIALPPRVRKIGPRRIASFDAVWVTNAKLLEFVNSTVPGMDVSVVSPFADVGNLDVLAIQERQQAVVVAAFGGHELYGVDVAVEAVRLCRANNSDLTLDILLYGPQSDERGSLKSTYREVDWVTFHEDLGSEAVACILRRSLALLRPTVTDGDSMLVREALSFGTRVIATDSVPRPLGVELAARDATSICRVLVDGGVRSTGIGLGKAVDTMVLDYLNM